jgi:hypothetical protein
VALVTLVAVVIAVLIALMRRADDLACFSWAVAATLFASPVVWGTTTP